MEEERLFRGLARELLTNLRQVVVRSAERDGGTLLGDCQRLVAVVQLVLGLASTGLGSSDLLCAWFVLRQEFAKVSQGQRVCQSRLRWLCSCLVEQVQS